MRTFRFHCPKCQQKFEAPEDYDGSELACPTCGEHFEANDWIKLQGLENATLDELKAHRQMILAALEEMKAAKEPMFKVTYRRAP